MTHDIDRYVNMFDIPTTWQDILTTIRREIDPHAVIAGGCLRDLIMKETPKDIDVFVFVPETDPYKLTQYRWTKLKSGRDIKNLSSKAPDSPGYINDSTFYFQGLKVNIINYRADHVGLLFENFDINSSMIMYNGSRVISDQSFRLFIEKGEIKVIREMRRTRDRIGLLMEKYSHATEIDLIEDEIPF